VGRVARLGIALIGAGLLATGCSGSDIAGSTTTVAASSAATTGGSFPPAEGWRLAVSAPTGAARVGSSMTVCYEVSGTSREPVVLEVTAVPPGAATGAAPIRVDIAVGRGSVRVPLTSVPPGTYDLRVQLVVSGRPVDGTASTIPSVTLAPDVPAGACS
jgi:hypothetical protein